jgi:hypothetical protein
MRLRLAAVLCAFSMLESALAAQELERRGPKQSLEVTSTERANFLPGGTIHIDRSYGYLSVEGWDEPEVQVTVTKSTDRFYKPERMEAARQRLDRIRVATERRSDTELSITTTPASRHGVTLDYRVQVPRDSRLVIHQVTGYVWVNDVTGGIEATCRTGDIIVMLPDPGPYSIDARTRMGSVTSDFTGKARNNQFLVGSRFTYGSPAPSRRIYLRMGIGSITIKNGPPSGPFKKE